MNEIDPLLTDSNNRKSRLSVVYALAIAARAGYMTADPSPDFDSVDLTIKAGGGMRPNLDLQIKATSPLEWKEGKAPFTIKRKNYDDLRCERQVPIFLMVLEMPSDEARWMDVGRDALLLRRCAWWISLKGEPEIDTESRTVHLFDTQRFDVEALCNLMQETRDRFS